MKNCHAASDELRDELRLGEDQSPPLDGDMVQDDTSLIATQSADQASVQGNTRLSSRKIMLVFSRVSATLNYYLGPFSQVLRDNIFFVEILHQPTPS